MRAVLPLNESLRGQGAQTAVSPGGAAVSARGLLEPVRLHGLSATLLFTQQKINQPV